MDNPRILIEEANAILQLADGLKGSYAVLSRHMIRRLADAVETLAQAQDTTSRAQLRLLPDIAQAQQPIIAPLPVTDADAARSRTALDNMPAAPKADARDAAKQDAEDKARLLAKTLVTRWRDNFGIDKRVPTHVLCNLRTSDNKDLRRIIEILSETIHHALMKDDHSNQVKGFIIATGLHKINDYLAQYRIACISDNGRYFILQRRQPEEMAR